MAVPASLLARLSTQLEALGLVLARATPGGPRRAAAARRSGRRGRTSPTWPATTPSSSTRLRRLLAEDRPALGRYRAEEDPDWPAWAALPLDEVLDRLQSPPGGADRPRAVACRRTESARTGLHPTFGEMDVAGWLDFFLLHEAHHLYTALVRVGEASRPPPQ